MIFSFDEVLYSNIFVDGRTTFDVKYIKLFTYSIARLSILSLKVSLRDTNADSKIDVLFPLELIIDKFKEHVRN